MKTLESKVDRFGRVLLPKVLREAAGLTLNSAVEMAVLRGDIILHPVNERSKTRVIRGVRVVVEPSTGDLANPVARVRKERHDRLTRGLRGDAA